MLPIGILRFSPTEGPAYFAEWLDTRGLRWELIALDEGDSVPARPRDFAGLGLMGGPMSVNDRLPWIEPVLALLRDAVNAEVPVLGHCLGGQLLSRALGGTVTRTATPEIGWIEVEVPDDPRARAWFGGRSRFTTFQWHNDVFSLPAGATQVLTNAYNPQQGFVVDGRHVGFQCHVEMTPELVDAWCKSGGDDLPAETEGARQSEAAIRAAAPQRLDALHDVADDIYAHWFRNLVDGA